MSERFDPSLNVAICEALGLNPETVADLTIHVRPGHYPDARVTHFIPTDGQLVRELHNYKLTPIGRPSPEQPKEQV